jgi:hypothetical protein
MSLHLLMLTARNYKESLHLYLYRPPAPAVNCIFVVISCSIGKHRNCSMNVICNYNVVYGVQREPSEAGEMCIH